MGVYVCVRVCVCVCVHFNLCLLLSDLSHMGADLRSTQQAPCKCLLNE